MIIKKIQEYCTLSFPINHPNKPFGALLGVSPTNHIFLKAFNCEYNEIKIWFTYQNSKQIEIEGRINLTMVIK